MNSKNKVHNVIICSGNEREANEWSSRLRTQGFAVEVPTGGFHALSLLEKEEFDIMLMAESMEDMSDMEIIAIARTAKEKSILPIIYIAPEENVKNSVAAIDQGANSYVLKKTGYFNDVVKKMKELLPR